MTKSLQDARADELFETMPRVYRLVDVPKGMSVPGFRTTLTNEGLTLAWIPVGLEVAS